MDLTVTDADIEVLANRLTVVMNDSYRKGQQAERERIKDAVAELLDPKDPWIHYSTLLEKIDAAL